MYGNLGSHIWQGRHSTAGHCLPQKKGTHGTSELCNLYITGREWLASLGADDDAANVFIPIQGGEQDCYTAAVRVHLSPLCCSMRFRHILLQSYWQAGCCSACCAHLVCLHW